MALDYSEPENQKNAKQKLAKACATDAGSPYLSATECLRLASRERLYAEDLQVLVLWNQEPLMRGDHGGQITFDDDGIRAHNNRMNTHLISLLSAEEKDVLAKLASNCRLALPCTPLELVEWRERNNEKSGWKDDEQGDVEIDSIALPDEFVRAVQAALANPAPAESKAQRELPAARRKNHDITKERGCRRLILEHWDDIEKMHGQHADGRQVWREIAKHIDASDRKPALKTVQNHLANLRNERLIP